jgi:hypothetical protein
MCGVARDAEVCLCPNHTTQAQELPARCVLSCATPEQPRSRISAGELAVMQCLSKHLPACLQVDLLQRLEGVMPSHLTSHFFCNSGAGGGVGGEGRGETVHIGIHHA